MKESTRAAIDEDIALAMKALRRMQTDWQGKSCVLELKEADYQWRQMEWWAFYFEHLCGKLLRGVFDIPGPRVGRVGFDLRRTICWDLKAKAIKSDDHRAVLNDTRAIDAVVKDEGAYGAMIALCDVDYNDEDRSFQRWHSALKGGLSQYEKDRRKRTPLSRYRKTAARLQEIRFVVLDTAALRRISIFRQGRNSNGRPREPKYMLDLEMIADLPNKVLKFGRG
jgi:hypothetical protein